MALRFWSRVRFVDAVAVGSTVLLCLIVVTACAAPAAPASAPGGAEAPAAEGGGEAAAAEAEAAMPENPSDASGFCIFDTGSGFLLISNLSGDCGSTANIPSIADRDQACEDIVPFDGSAAYDAVTDRPIGWTFGVNFDVLSSAGNPLGCLHVYERDDANGTYVPVDNGGIVVDTCTIDTSPSTGMTPTIGGGTASFCQAGLVRCEMAVGRWIEDSTLQAYLLGSPQALPTLAQELANFAPGGDVMHKYPTFTLVADAAWPDDACPLDAEQELPVVRYVPEGGSGPTYAIDLYTPGDRVVTIPDATCSAEQIEIDTQAGLRVWRDHSESAESSDPYALYKYQLDGGPIEACTVSGPLDPVSLWVGIATLYIGFDPDRPDTGFSGVIDGVLVDPYDSKPPTAEGPNG